MSEQENIKEIQKAFEAFGRGDVPAILSTLTDDIEWHGLLGAPSHVPTSGLRKGKQQVAGFFQTLVASVDFQGFEPREFLANGDTVAVLGASKVTVKATGKPFAAEWVMAFTFRNGKVAKFREFSDSYGLSAAFQK